MDYIIKGKCLENSWWMATIKLARGLIVMDQHTTQFTETLNIPQAISDKSGSVQEKFCLLAE